MPGGLYNYDALAWEDRQAAILRHLAAGDRLSETVDRQNVIEAVRDVGLRKLRAVLSLLKQAMIHLLQVHARPNNEAADLWRGKAAIFLTDARSSFSSSMRQRIAGEKLYLAANYVFEAQHACLSPVLRQLGAEQQPIALPPPATRSSSPVD